jgi:hypothetical protein
MPNLATLNQVITQAVHCDNMFCEHQQEKRRELPIVLKNFAPIMLFPSITFTSKDDPMQIDRTQFKPLIM